MARYFAATSGQQLLGIAGGATNISGTAFTMACWLNSVTPNVDKKIICKQFETGPLRQYSMGTDATGHITGLIGDGASGADTLTTVGSIAANKWYHACYRKRGTGANAFQLFLDGRLENSMTSNVVMGTSGAVLLLGRLQGFAQEFNGQVAHVGIWDASLTDEEIAYLASGGSPLDIRVQNLRGCWLLDDYAGSNGNALDTSSNAQTLTRTGVMSVQPDNFKQPRELVYAPEFNVASKPGASVVPPTMPDYGSTLFANNNANFYGVNNNAAIAITVHLTMSAWVNFNSVAVQQMFFDKWQGNTVGDCYFLQMSAANTLQFGVGTGSGTAAATAATSVQAGRWYHVVGVSDGTSTRIYLNGVLDGTGSGSAGVNNAATVLRMGNYPGSSLPFNGRMAHCTLWSNALTPQEILELYKGQTVYSTRPNALRAYWPLGSYGTKDAVGGSHAILNGSLFYTSDGPPYDPPVVPSALLAGAELTAGAATDSATVLVDLQPSGAETVSITEIGTVLVDIQPSGTDGLQYLDAATTYMDITIHTCEWFIPKPQPEFLYTDYLKWSWEAETKWRSSAQPKWQYTANVVTRVPVEICN